MIFTDIKDSIVSFYRESNKPTFCFAFVILWQLCAFLPSIPSVAVYSAFFIYAVYVLLHSKYRRFYRPLLAFLIYIPIQLVIVEPPEIFNSWERYVLFMLLLICVSPLLSNEEQAINRQTIFFMSIAVCTFIGVGSFLARFLGINYGIANKMDFVLMVGTFGGLTRHSMLLGPCAAIGAIFCAWMGYRHSDKKYWIMSVCCLFSVMFSASRAALMGAVFGLTILIYKLSESRTKFTKIIVGTLLLGSVSFPLWGSALDLVIQKYQGNIAEGGAYSSREALWTARVDEFESSPLLGVGFDAVDLDIASAAGGVDIVSGMVESGSSWLIILSMTGLIGALILFPMFYSTYRSVYSDTSPGAALLCAVLSFFYVHMIAEGYIFYGGSLLAFLLWITVGVSRDLKNAVENTLES